MPSQLGVSAAVRAKLYSPTCHHFHNLLPPSWMGLMTTPYTFSGKSDSTTVHSRWLPLRHVCSAYPMVCSSFGSVVQCTISWVHCCRTTLISHHSLRSCTLWMMPHNNSMPAKHFSLMAVYLDWMYSSHCRKCSMPAILTQLNSTQLNSTQFIFSCVAIFLSWTAILSCCEFQFVDRLPFVDRLTAFPQTPSMWLVV